jgi:hypothetical protein
MNANVPTATTIARMRFTRNPLLWRGNTCAPVLPPLVTACAPVLSPLVATYAPLVAPLHPERLGLGI